jgi:putative transposase
MIYYS